MAFSKRTNENKFDSVFFLCYTSGVIYINLSDFLKSKSYVVSPQSPVEKALYGVLLSIQKSSLNDFEKHNTAELLKVLNNRNYNPHWRLFNFDEGRQKK